MTRLRVICLIGFNLLVLADLSQGRSDYGKFFEKCTIEKNPFDCFKRRALEVLDSAIKDDTVYVINDYISIAKDSNVKGSSSSSSTSINSNSNPSSDEGTDNNTTERSIDQELDQKFHDYLSSRSVRLTIPGNTFEGRGKKKGKGYGAALMMGGLAMAGVLAQLAFGKIAFLAGTALLTAKIALVLSAIIGLKKLVSSGGGGHEVIYATASEHHGGGGGGGGGYGGGGGWQRALEAITHS
ncbi:uncharacterized protein LOC122505162 [Leptopilina heterotoma]|uniref:uncharacterized protein LOC122505162 n=1 Tax=Leptopilina heterotoma TaxID=63436 RepID=UPI001CA7F443|nr:uncharacterized protein LOC122505162 [Leptopilina heterotoma]